ncbi:MAG: NFACT family protein, partial [Limnochordales bacterium]
LYDGFGPFAAREVLVRAGLDPDTRHGDLTAADRERIVDAFLTLVGAVAAGRFAPVVVLDDAGQPLDFWAFPPAQAPGPLSPCPSPSQAAAAYFNHRLATLGVQRQRQRLERLVAAARARLGRKVENLRQDLAGAARAEEYRLYGELLTAHLHRIPRGETVTLPNYHAGDAPVTIPLDPALSPAENAQRYFKRYAKARAAQAAVQTQLDAAVAELAYLDQVAIHLEMADSLEALAELEAELEAAGVASPAGPKAAGDGRPHRAARPGSDGGGKPLEARTRRGARVLIGRSNRQNDRLTLRTARPDDIWLHVKDLPGAHVILQVQGEPDEEDLRDAAQLAAYFSKARHSSSVAVDWTRARHVRKPKGARPGMVIYDHHKTIYVSPDEAAVSALLAMSRR